MINYLKIFFKNLCCSFKLFTSLLFLHILEISFAQSQRIIPNFSTISEIPLYRGNQNLLVGDFNGDGVKDICSYSNNVITILYKSDSSNQYNIKYFETDSKNFTALAEDINNDQITDILCLDASQKLFRTYIGSEKDTLLSKSKYRLDDFYSKFIVTDINNDGNQDVAFFGKKNLGLTVLLGKGDGTFKSTKHILQDYFFSDVMIRNCSEDDIPDIFAINWIENKILYFSSYAPMKYLSPSVISFGSEPVSFKTLYLNDDDFIDIIVLLEDRKSFVTFLGDNLGNFTLKDVISLPFKVDKYFIDDEYNLFINNLLIFNKENSILSIYGKDNSFRYKENIVYSLGTIASDFELLVTSDTSDINLLVTSEKQKKLFIINNYQNPLTDGTSQKYLTMPVPENIFMIDQNNDGFSDLILSSSGDYDCSYYYYVGNDRFSGMINLKGFPKKLENLFFVKSNDSGSYYLTTHNSLPTVNLAFINRYNLNSFYYPISGVSNPQVLNSNIKNNEPLEFFISSYEDNSNYFDLYYYKHLGNYRFFEKQVNDIGDKIAGITVVDLNNDNILDYLYLRRNSKNKLTLISSIVDSNQNVIRNKKYFELPDTNVARLYLLKADINNDKFNDLLIYSPDRMELIVSLFDSKDTIFHKPHQRIENIKLSDLNNIQFCDFDLNNQLDLIVGNSYTQTLQVYFNQGGYFGNPETIMGIYGINRFLAADFNHDSLIDLALIYKDGYLKIVYGKK